MSLKLISKYRSCLMALAMIWIGCYHTYYCPKIKVFDFLIYRHGYLGIDVFVFLSGFGIYHSIKKNDGFKTYIWRRIKRIFPYCIPIYIVYSWLSKEKILYTFADCLGLSIFIRNNLVNWFTSFVFILYLLSPLFIKIFDKKPTLITMLSIIIIILLCFISNKFDFIYVYFRICVYILGLYFGYLHYNNIQISSFIYFIIFGLSVFGFASIYFLNHYYRNDIMYIIPSILIVPGLLLFTCFILDKVKILYKPLNYLGSFTYQFYLLNIYVVDYMTTRMYGLLYRPGIHFDFWLSHSTIIISIILSIIYKKLIDSTLNVIMKKEKTL